MSPTGPDGPAVPSSRGRPDGTVGARATWPVDGAPSPDGAGRACVFSGGWGRLRLETVQEGADKAPSVARQVAKAGREVAKKAPEVARTVQKKAPQAAKGVAEKATPVAKKVAKAGREVAKKAPAAGKRVSVASRDAARKLQQRTQKKSTARKNS